MDKNLFRELVQSMEEARAIAQGQAAPSRQFTVDVNVARAAREQTGLSQNEFARMLRVSVKTLQNWEQQRRTPTGPAAALLAIVRQSPEAALKALR